MQGKTIVWIIVILVIFGLLIWGASRFGGEKGGADDSGKTGNDAQAQQDVNSFVDNSFSNENDNIDLGDLI